MKTLKLTLLVGLLLALVPFASAYGMYGPLTSDQSTSSSGGFSGYGYGYTPTYQNFNVDEQSFDRSNLFQSSTSGSSSLFNDIFQTSVVNDFAFGEQSSFDSGFGQYLNDGNLQLGDGFDLTVDKCGKRIVKGNIDGEPFRVVEKVCSPVSGRLWRDNSLSTSFQNQQGFDTVNTQLALSQNDAYNEFTNTQRSESENAYSQTQDFSEQQSNYGRGVVIVLN